MQTLKIILMKMTTLIASSTFALLGLVSCKKDTTSAENTSTFSYQLGVVNRTSVVARTATAERTAGTSILWTTGTASANELKFEAENSAGEVEFKQKTAQQIDLFSASSSLGNITIPPGTYNEVEFKALLAPASSNPALELSGSFTSAGVTKQIKFIVNSSLELKAEKANVTVAQGSLYSALNNIDLSQLTANVSETALNNAAVTNGVIVLSASSNQGIYQTILDNLGRHHGEAEVHHH